MKAKVIVLFFVVCFMLVSCKQEVTAQTVTIASWNVQNLFDGNDDGTEGSYSEYTSYGSWTEESYKQRLEKTVKVLNTGKLAEASIIVLNEVENENVVKDILTSRSMSRRKFRWYALARQEDSAISLGVISSIPIVNAKIHNTDYRPILEASFEVNGEKLTVLAIHAKSRIDGEEETAQIRKNTAKTLEEIAENILLTSPETMVLIAGDFNDSYTDNCMMSLLENTAPLKLCSSPEGSDWYCFWTDSKKSIWPSGSYYWSKEDSWFAYDNILVKDVSSILDVVDSGVLFEGIIRTADNKPNAFVRKLLSGVSDHLPVWISVF